MLDKQMRLEELLGREVTIRWFEGVTLIQAVCRQLLAHEGHHDAFPTAAEILLAADGTVATTHASGRTAVRTAAQLLGRMLSEDVPVRLRLIVAQATGADTAYPTLDEFSAALAYFERPDSNQVLRALFERAMAAPARATAAAEAAAAPVALPEQEYQDQSRNRTHLRLVVGAAVTAACVLAAWLGASAVDYSRLGVAFTSLAGSGSSGGSREPAASRTKSAGVGTAGGAASDTRRGSARAPEHSATRTGARPAAKPPAPERVAGRVTAERSASRKDPLQVAALLPLAMSSSPIAPAAEYRPVFGETVEVTASEASPEDEVAANGARIFTRADAGVVPPRSVYPKLPSDSQNPSEPDTRTVLELVIGTNGLVERAKLRSIPRDIHEFMLVSAAKAWIFEPATIDGAAVRYRHQVRIMLP